MKKVLVSLLGYAPATAAAACASGGASAAADDAANSLLLTAASNEHETCPADSPWSCSAGTTESCCYEGQNGIFLQTQFWDYSPATGGNTTWTLHGLWNDRCTGGYQQFCNPQWAITSAEDTLRTLGQDALVDKMSEVWKNQGGPDNTLWTHEFNKHGTCMSTVNPACYAADAAKYQNVGDFFNRTVSLWEELTTYEWLANAGILPSEDKTWSVAEFSDALARHTDGRTVYLGCDRNNAVYQVWYFFALKGSMAAGDFKFIDSITTSSCTDGFKYLPKGHSSGGGGGGSDDDGEYRKTTINVVLDETSGGKGCLISDGSWFTSGTCATFRVRETVGGVSLSSSKGPCGVVNGVLRCSRGTPETDFELQDGLLSFGGSTQWGARDVPQSNKREPLTPNRGGGVTVELQTSL